MPAQKPGFHIIAIIAEIGYYHQKRDRNRSDRTNSIAAIELGDRNNRAQLNT